MFNFYLKGQNKIIVSLILKHQNFLSGLREGVKLRIAQNKPSRVSPQKDSRILEETGAAEVNISC